MRLLSNLLRRFIRQGTLRVRAADGNVHVFGDRLPGPDVAIQLHDRKLYTKLFINPELYAAEAYMDGTLTLEDGAAIHDFLLLFSVNRAGLYSYGSQKLMRRVWRGLRRWHQANPIGLAAAHARHHYDISTELYRLFLDDQMQYSCAYFRSDADTLDQAQEQKLDYILAKLRVEPGHRLLDIGCGWGALIIRAAAKYGCIATGITLSRNQYQRVRERILAEGLEGRCEVRLQDYRNVPETGGYDRIASVGMFEHVGLKHLGAYFRKMDALLAGGGVALNHGITSAQPHNRIVGMGVGKFIDKYVFPDGELPHISLVLREMSAAGFEVTDVESLRRHYARTCEHWAENIEKNRTEAVRIAGEKRYRIWSIYLAGCAFGFARDWMNVYQVLAVKARRPNHIDPPAAHRSHPTRVFRL